MLKQFIVTAIAIAVLQTTAIQSAAALPLPSATPDSVGMSAQRLANIDAFFKGEIDRQRVPGAVVAIARNGKLVYFKAFGMADAAKGVVMQTDTIFQLASMTKIQAAVGALVLTEQGKLPLQSKLTDYFPAFGTMQVGVPGIEGKFTLEPQKRPILIHDLFRHTSGIPYGGRPDGSSAIAAEWPSGGAAQNMGTAAEFANSVAKLPLVYQPGTVFEYGLSFDVLSAVVEKITGKSLGGHLSGTVWTPLKMGDTTFRPTEAQMARVARAFPYNPLDGKPQSILAIQRTPSFDCAGACAFGSMADCIRFGLGVAVRLQPGLAAVPGNPGEFRWNGANGTGFFCNPKEQLVVAFGTAAPGELRKYYREQVQDLVYGALSR